MERRHFLKLAFGLAAGAAVLAASARAAPLAPHPLNGPLPPSNDDPRPADISEDEVKRLKPEEVRWGHGRGHHRGWHRGHHWGWRRRHWGWRRRHYGWRRRHWGWHHRRRWHRRYWRRRYW